MSFTQKERKNIGENAKHETEHLLPFVTSILQLRCNGCEKQCRLSSGPAIDKCGDVGILPFIDGKSIKEYIDKNGKHRYTSYTVHKYFDRTSDGLEKAFISAIVTARKIAMLCDHYKTR